MEDEWMRLDASAAAGMLKEMFQNDLTAGRGMCSVCGVVTEMGSDHLYMNPNAPGAVLRCSECEGLHAVVVRGGGRYRFTMQGYIWIEIPDPAAT